MHVVYTKSRPMQFHLYPDFSHAKKDEHKKNLPSPGLYLTKIDDNWSDEAMFDKLNNLFKPAHWEPLTQNEKEDLAQKRAMFLGTASNSCSLAQPSIVPPIGDNNPRLRLYLPKEIAVYADGSFSDGFGGYAAIFLESGRPFASLSGCGRFASSAEVEWKAVDMALSAIVGDGHHVHVYTDHVQIVQTLYSDNPKHEAGTEPYCQRILGFCGENTVSFHHVRGHNGFDGSEWNELADVLAKHERQRIEAQSH